MTGKNGIILKTKDELKIMKESGIKLYNMFRFLKDLIEPGISTYELNEAAEKYIMQRNGIPAFKNYQGFPAALCVSVNEEVVHGIPSKEQILKEGDIISIDSGIIHKEFYSDSAYTFPVGDIDEEKKDLIEITRTSLEIAIEKTKPGNMISDISRAVENYVKKNGYYVVRNYVGHGIGRNLHEPPEVPNFYTPSADIEMKPGLVIAIEPMVNIGTSGVRVLKNGWTVVTKNRKPSAHFEHTIAVTEDGCEILTKE